MQRYEKGLRKVFLGESMITVKKPNGDSMRIRFIKHVVGVVFLTFGLGL